MKTIGAFTDDIEPDIDFAVGEDNHYLKVKVKAICLKLTNYNGKSMNFPAELHHYLCAKCVADFI
jgi:hypothetical protein